MEHPSVLVPTVIFHKDYNLYNFYEKYSYLVIKKKSLKLTKEASSCKRVENLVTAAVRYNNLILFKDSSEDKIVFLLQESMPPPMIHGIAARGAADAGKELYYIASNYLPLEEVFFLQLQSPLYKEAMASCDRLFPVFSLKYELFREIFSCLELDTSVVQQQNILSTLSIYRQIESLIVLMNAFPMNSEYYSVSSLCEASFKLWGKEKPDEVNLKSLVSFKETLSKQLTKQNLWFIPEIDNSEEAALKYDAMYRKLYGLED